jgi:biopolymer transport protein ExbB
VTTLLDYWNAGGPLMYPLAALCLAIWYWTMSVYPRLGRINVAVREVQGLLHETTAAQVAKALRAWAARRPGPLARIVRYATDGELKPGAVRERLAEARSAEIPPLEREVWTLRAMVAAAPLLGLLGTVRGMIATFLVLSVRGTASMELLSEGISEALVTTQVGLVIAVPGLMAALGIGRRLSGLNAAVDRIESHLLVSLARRPGQGVEVDRRCP